MMYGGEGPLTDRITALETEIKGLRAALQDALDVMVINEKVRSPSWDGEATEASAIGKARAALTHR